jgi:hypothetical protein
VRFLLFYLIFFTSLYSSEIAEYINKAKTLQLSKKPYWSKLLHYVDGESIIEEDEFFLSKDGKTDKEDELVKTIESFLKDSSSTCRYPARYKWIDSYLHLNTKPSTCKDLDKYLKDDFKNISIVFTAPRYNSPSSMFGHTFLKVDSKYTHYAINYSAVIPDDTDPISYFVKGGSGGFLSHYEFLIFDIKDFEYRKEEFRDLISYNLTLSKDEINNIMLHLYEIKDTNEPYYFTSRNCSSEILKLLDMAKYNSDMAKELSTITLPIDVVYILENNNLIDKISVKYSKLKLFNKHLETLSDDEKKILFKVIHKKMSTDELDKLEISRESKVNIILAAKTYIQMNMMAKNLDSSYVSSLINLIKLDIKYKIDNKKAKDIPLKENPISNKYHKLSMGSRSMQDAKTQYNIAYRYIYSNRFDLLSNEQQNGSIEFLDMRLRYVDDEISVDNITILNVESLPISNEFFTQNTSNMIFGSKRLFYDDALYSYFEYAYGYRFRYNKYFTYRLALRGGAYYHNEDIYMASLESAITFSYTNKFVSELKYEANSYTDSTEAYNLYLNNYYKLTKQTTIDILLSHKNDIRNYDEIKINYSIYF